MPGTTLHSEEPQATPVVRKECLELDRFEYHDGIAAVAPNQEADHIETYLAKIYSDFKPCDFAYLRARGHGYELQELPEVLRCSNAEVERRRGRVNRKLKNLLANTK